jgi:iron-sulfur cluster repair protein YtfE (RIC family)
VYNVQDRSLTPTGFHVEEFTMATTIRALDCAQGVNEILTLHPATKTVFNRFGVDLCCGGSLSVQDAARASGANCDALCDALQHAVQPDEDAR